MPLEIPGYYFDAEKNKYFKIEKSQTATSSAQWTSESVKRRKIQDAERDAAQRRAHLTRNHIKRSVLRRDPVADGLLARECERGGTRGRMDERDYGAAVWARGLVDKGGVAFVPRAERGKRFAPMRCFYVAGEESNTEVGVAYMTIEEEMVVGTYLETDENERIGLRDERTMARLGSVTTYQAEMIRCPRMSSIRYHKPSHKMLITSSDADESCGLYMFTPPVATTIDDKKHWHIGETDHYQRIAIRPRSQPQSLIYKATPAPSSSPLLCIIGTNAGVLSVSPNGSTAGIAPGPLFSRQKNDNTPGEVFDQDFQVGNHNVVFAGGRKSRLWMTDLRDNKNSSNRDGGGWTHIRTDSSIAHLRSVNAHQVLVAGLQNSMALYDLRFLKSGMTSRNRYKPLLRFPEYRNEAHFWTGFDVSVELSVVASAQDDGTVKLFSLRSGKMLKSGSGGGGGEGGRDVGERRGLAGVKADVPIRAVQFERMQGERMESLFVGDGMVLRKFSCGTIGDEE